MAENTEKKVYKEMDDAEKYRFWKNWIKRVGTFTASAAVTSGVLWIAYKAGKYAGAYDLAEEIWKKCPEVHAVLREMDGAYFTDKLN